MALLDRFRGARASRTVAEEIGRNVKSLLSMRRGYGAVVQELGISDIYGGQSRRVVEELLIHDITECLNLYEPRLCDVEVEVPPDGERSRVRCLIRGRLKEGGEIIEFELSPFSGEGPRMVDAQMRGK